MNLDQALLHFNDFLIVLKEAVVLVDKEHLEALLQLGCPLRQF